MTLDKITADFIINVPMPRWRAIAEEVCKQHGVSFDTAIRKEGPRARQTTLTVRVAIARALSSAGYKSTEIGRRLHRDHTTVLWYLGRLSNGRKLP